jgi:Uma2 family endonuclease
MATHEQTTDDQLHLGQRDQGRLISSQEFADAFYDEPWTYERVNGRLVVLSPHETSHVLLSNPWRCRLAVYSLNHPEIVQAVVSYAWTRIDDDNDRIADIGVYLGGSLEDLNIPDQVPEVIFDFDGPSTVDRIRDFVKLGVRELVTFDRLTNMFTVLKNNDSIHESRVLTSADVYRSPLLPGFEVRLAEVLPR